MLCTFFGHRYANNEVRPKLTECLTQLIENENATKFFVGTQGNFDNIVWEVLTALRSIYPHIVCYKVLAYLPTYPEKGGKDTIFPEGLETVPKRFTITKRNEWMISQADTVITYVKHTAGGSYKFQQLALRKGKRVIEL